MRADGFINDNLLCFQLIYYSGKLIMSIADYLVDQGMQLTLSVEQY